MGESSEKPTDIQLRFKLKNPDDSYVQEVDTVTKVERDKVIMMTPDDVRSYKSMGYKVEPVEPKPDTTRINLSQTTFDKDKEE